MTVRAHEAGGTSLIIHHLSESRSFRVLWLCEELGIDYQLASHTRLKGMRAPAALGELHPLGKAPLIVDAGLVLAESGAILPYLHDRNSGALRPAAGSPARAIHDELFEFVEGSGMPPLMSTLLGRLTDGFTPVMWSVVRRERTRVLARVESALSANDYLCGARLMLADIQMAYLVAFADGLGLVDRHGGVLRRYLDRLLAREAYRRAVVIGGQPVGSMPAGVPRELAV